MGYTLIKYRFNDGSTMKKEELLKNAYDLLCEFTTPKARFPVYFLRMFDGDEKVTEALIFGKDKLLEDTSKMQYVMDFYAQKCDEFENKVTMLAQALGCSAYNLFFAAISDEDYIEDIENISREKLVALKPGGDAAQICADVGLREVTTKKVLDEIRRMKLED